MSRVSFDGCVESHCGGPPPPAFAIAELRLGECERAPSLACDGAILAVIDERGTPLAILAAYSVLTEEHAIPSLLRLPPDHRAGLIRLVTERGAYDELVFHTYALGTDGAMILRFEPTPHVRLMMEHPAE